MTILTALGQRWGASGTTCEGVGMKREAASTKAEGNVAAAGLVQAATCAHLVVSVPAMYLRMRNKPMCKPALRMAAADSYLGYIWDTWGYIGIWYKWVFGIHGFIKGWRMRRPPSPELFDLSVVIPSATDQFP
jgi:hypothetical protein